MKKKYLISIQTILFIVLYTSSIGQTGVVLTASDPNNPPKQIITPTQISFSPWIQVKLKSYNYYYEQIINVPEITKEIIQNGAVFVFMNDSSSLYPVVKQLPIFDILQREEHKITYDVEKEYQAAYDVFATYITYLDFQIELGKIKLKAYPNSTEHKEIFTGQKEMLIKYLIIPGEAGVGYTPTTIFPAKDSNSNTSMNQPKVPNLQGTWYYKMISTSGVTRIGTINFSETEFGLKGSMSVNDNTKNDMTGNFDGTTLSLNRPTGLETTQIYSLTLKDKTHFSGTYKNEGRYLDSGTIEIYKQSQ